MADVFLRPEGSEGSRTRLCANPGCNYLIHADPEFGGYCCKKCHWTHQSRGARSKSKHGVRCQEKSAPVEGQAVLPRADPDPPVRPFLDTSPSAWLGEEGLGVENVGASDSWPAYIEWRSSAQWSGLWAYCLLCDKWCNSSHLASQRHVLREQAHLGPGPTMENKWYLLEAHTRVQLVEEVARLREENARLLASVAGALRQETVPGDMFQVATAAAVEALRQLQEESAKDAVEPTQAAAAHEAEESSRTRGRSGQRTPRGPARGPGSPGPRSAVPPPSEPVRRPPDLDRLRPPERVPSFLDQPERVPSFMEQMRPERGPSFLDRIRGSLGIKSPTSSSATLEECQVDFAPASFATAASFYTAADHLDHEVVTKPTKAVKSTELDVVEVVTEPIKAVESAEPNVVKAAADATVAEVTDARVGGRWVRYSMSESQGCWWYCEATGDWFQESCPGAWTRYMDPNHGLYWWQDDNNWFFACSGTQDASMADKAH